MRYCEQLARQIFMDSPALTTEDEILEAGYRFARGELSKKSAIGLFGYDPDFPGDFIDEYKHLQGASQ